MKAIWQFLFSLFVVASVYAGPAGTIDPSFNIGAGPDGVLRGLCAVHENKVLVFGDFDRWEGVATGGIVRLLPDGSRDTTFNAGGGQFDIYGVWQQPDKKIVANMYAFSRENLVRFNEDGSPDITFTADVDNTVADVAFLPDGRLLIVGSFTKVDGVARKSVAVLQRNGKLDPSFVPEAGMTGDGTAAHVLPDGRFLIAGLNSHSSVLGLLRMTAEGVVDKGYDLGTTSLFAKKIFPLADGNLALEAFTRPARALSNDALDTHFTNGSGSSSLTIAARQSDERLLANGYSLKDGNGNASKLVRLYADGKIDPSFVTSLSEEPQYLVIRDDERIVIGGYFSLNGGPSTKNVLCLFANDETAPTEVLWNARAQDAVHNGPVTLKVIRQGNLTSPSSVNWTAAFLADQLQIAPTSGVVEFAAGESTADVKVTFASQRNVNAEAQFKLSDAQGAVFGALTNLSVFVTNEIGGITLNTASNSISEVIGPLSVTVSRTGALNRPATVAWRLEGPTDPLEDFTTSTGLVTFAATATIANIALHTKDNVVVQSNRNYQLRLVQTDEDWSVTNVVQTALAVLDNDTANGPGRGVDGSVTDSIKLADGGAVIYGQFTTVNGTPATNIARLDAAGNVSAGFQLPESNGSIQKIWPAGDGKYLAYGPFTSIGGYARTNLARLHADGSVDDTWESNFTNWVGSALARADGSILLSGNGLMIPFNGYRGGTNMGAIVRLFPNGKKDTNFFTATYTSGTLEPANVGNGQFYAYGAVVAWEKPLTNFQNTLPTPLRHGIVRFNVDGSIDPTFQVNLPTTNSFRPPTVAMPIAPSRIYVYPDGRVLAGGSYLRSVNSRDVPGLARLLPTGELDLPFLTNLIATLKTPGQSTNVTDFDVNSSGTIMAVMGGFGSTPGHLDWIQPDGQRSFYTSFPGIGFNSTVRAYDDGTALLTGSFTSDQIGYRVSWFGSNHKGMAAPPKITIAEIERNGEDTTLRTFVREEGRYRLQTSDDLLNWSDVGANDYGLGAQTVPVQSPDERRFYRFVR